MGISAYKWETELIGVINLLIKLAPGFVQETTHMYLWLTVSVAF